MIYEIYLVAEGVETPVGYTVARDENQALARASEQIIAEAQEYFDIKVYILPREDAVARASWMRDSLEELEKIIEDERILYGS